MDERKRFERTELFDILTNASKVLESEIDVYLIGGLAMIYYGSKLSTKDIDVVFDSEDSMHRFVEALKEVGFNKVRNLSREYMNLETRNVMEGENGCRFDIFVDIVCNCFLLSEGMKKRAHKVSLPGKLKLNIVSPEDIFLFKSITGRDDDLSDMSMIAGHGLNWSIIEKELMSQPNYWKWLLHYFVNLEDLEREYGVVSPTKQKLSYEAEISAGIAVLLTKFEEKSLSAEDIINILDENDEVYCRAVIGKMIKLKMIIEDDGKYSLIDH